MVALENWKLEEVRNAKIDWEWRVRLTGRGRRNKLGHVESLRTTVIGQCFNVTEEEAEKDARARCLDQLTDATAIVETDYPGPIGLLIDEDLSSLKWTVEEVTVCPLDPLVIRLGAFRDYVNLELQLAMDAFGPKGTKKQKRRWDHLCAFLDVMDDTAKALVAFLLDGVEGAGRYGESFLRLTGLLACVSNQQYAIMELYSEFGEDFLKNRRDALDLKAWATFWDLRNLIACHSLGNRYLGTHVPIWTQGYYLGFRRVNKTTSEHEYSHKVNLAPLLRGWQQDAIVVLDDLQERVDRAVRGDGGNGPPAA
jgi:hypothetical protein